MSSEVKANKLSPATGTAVALGDSGDTFTVPSGATLANAGTLNIPSGGNLTIASGGTITNSGTATGFGGDNTPAFQAYRGTDQTLVVDTNDLIEFDTETFDTDGEYDHTTNYRFTPQTAGKYYVYCHAICYSPTTNDVDQARLTISLNNSSDIAQGWFDPHDSYPFNKCPISIFTIVDMNGSSDYLIVKAMISTVSGVAPKIEAGVQKAVFGAWKMIGI